MSIPIITSLKLDTTGLSPVKVVQIIYKPELMMNHSTKNSIMKGIRMNFAAGAEDITGGGTATQDKGATAPPATGENGAPTLKKAVVVNDNLGGDELVAPKVNIVTGVIVLFSAAVESKKAPGKWFHMCDIKRTDGGVPLGQFPVNAGFVAAGTNAEVLKAGNLVSITLETVIEDTTGWVGANGDINLHTYSGISVTGVRIGTKEEIASYEDEAAMADLMKYADEPRKFDAMLALKTARLANRR